MVIQGKTLTEGDIFVLAPYEIADPIFLTDCQVLIIKTPSIPGDKYEFQSTVEEKKQDSLKELDCCKKINENYPLDRQVSTVKTLTGTKKTDNGPYPNVTNFNLPVEPTIILDIKFDDLFTTKPICKQIESEPFSAELIPPSSFTIDKNGNRYADYNDWFPVGDILIERELKENEIEPESPTCAKCKLLWSLRLDNKIYWVYKNI